MSAEILESEETASVQNMRKGKTLVKAHKHVFMPNVCQHNQNKLLEPVYWPERIDTGMKAASSHEAALYQSQRKISISDFPSFKNFNSINNSNADSKSTQVDSEVQNDSKKTSNAEFSFESNSRFANFDYKMPDFNRIFSKAQALAKIYNGHCMSQSSFSNCKGHNSIRFNCQNGHNFYLTEEMLRQANISDL